MNGEAVDLGRRHAADHEAATQQVSERTRRQLDGAEVRADDAAGVGQLPGEGLDLRLAGTYPVVDTEELIKAITAQ